MSWREHGLERGINVPRIPQGEEDSERLRLSRFASGLLMPRVGVEHHGIQRTDVGNLGSGIYFSDAFRSVGGVGRPLG